MAWFRNHYHCGDCGADWDDEWSCCCDDECPECGSRDWSPVSSDDLTFVTENDGDVVVIYESPIWAEDRPRYREVAIAPNAGAAEAHIGMRLATYWDQGG